MEILAPQIVHSEVSPLLYHHPYLVSRNSIGSLLVWSFTNAPVGPPTLCTVLEGRTIFPSCYFLSPECVVSLDPVDLQTNIILVHSLPDGKLLDRKILQWVQVRDVAKPSPAPAPGECTFLMAASGCLAVWKNGSHAGDGCIEVYGISATGKLALMSQLHAPNNAPSLVTRNSGYDYLLPEPVHLTSQYFLGSLTFHPSSTIHLIRWSSTELQSSWPMTTYVKLDCTRRIPDVIMNVTLQDHLFISDLNQLILAHYEYPLDLVDNSPITAIRSINPDILWENWCTPINQELQNLYHHPTLGVLIAIGSTHDTNCLGVAVIDVYTGQILREDNIGERPLNKCGPLASVPDGVQCGMTHSMDELIVAFGDGQFSVTLLPEFVVHGFTKRDITALVTTPFPEFPLSTPKNTKEKRKKTNGSWHWINRVFFADGQLIIEPESSSGFVVMRWR